MVTLASVPSIRYARRILVILGIILIAIHFGLQSRGVEVSKVSKRANDYFYNRQSATAAYDYKIAVCIIGNAETTTDASRVYAMWGGKLPTTFFVWGDRQKAGTSENGQLSVLVEKGGAKLSWAEGVERAYEYASKKFDCDYYFTHDDDLYFYVPDTFQNRFYPDSPEGLTTRLKDLLVRYRPAVASFPWAVGDSTYAPMRDLAEKYMYSEVAPLTGFDNGMVIYHKSVVRMFIPFSPRGEGDFYGQWTLCAHFLQMFAPLVFRENAIRINAIRYHNSISLDNTLTKDSAAHQQITIKDGKAYVPESRHPYEYPNNIPYMKFLTSGLHDSTANWGRTLSVNEAPFPQRGPETYSVEFVLRRLGQQYDPQHPAIANNYYMRKIATPGQIRQVIETKDYQITVKMFMCTRLESFKRLWRSFMDAAPIKQRVNVEIIVDRDVNAYGEIHMQVKDYLATLNNPFGSLTITPHRSHMGLRNSVMTAWHPTRDDEYAIFLEEDVEVSKYFLQYAAFYIDAYAHPTAHLDKMIGISLYSQKYSDVLEQFTPTDTSGQPYLYQMPQSFGCVYFPKAWREFVLYARAFEHVDALVPNSMTNRWPYRESWKKILMRYMVEKGAVILYPNLPSDLSLATVHTDDVPSSVALKQSEKAKLSAKYDVPILDLEDGETDATTYFESPPASELAVYDYLHVEKRLKSLALGEDVQSFDKCTLVLMVYSRIKTMADRLHYYEHFDYLDSIVVVWSNLNEVPPELNPDDYIIPVHILRMKQNSLNDRFYPHSVIKTDCIINMDDDYDMPFHQLKYSVDVWRGQFFNHLVGFSAQGRNHIHREVTTKDGAELQYLYSPSIWTGQELRDDQPAFYSIVLTPGFVYHRKYQHLYFHEDHQPSLDIVDQYMNCEDILFNFMIANATKSGPVVVDAWQRMITFGSNQGLWKRPKHSVQRSKCINDFVKTYGYMPLQYTTSFFDIDADYIPVLEDLKYQKKIPRDYPCKRSQFEQLGTCALDIQTNIIGAWSNDEAL